MQGHFLGRANRRSNKATCLRPPPNDRLVDLSAHSDALGAISRGGAAQPFARHVWEDNRGRSRCAYCRVPKTGQFLYSRCTNK
jgi:hypothetical protein